VQHKILFHYKPRPIVGQHVCSCSKFKLIISKLADIIERDRGKLVALGAYYGINDPKVLRASRELDKIIIKYYKSCKRKSIVVP
jgi:hypothetical protein